MRDFLVPGFQGTFGLGVSLPEVPQRPLGNDAHYNMLPIWEQPICDESRWPRKPESCLLHIRGLQFSHVYVHGIVYPCANTTVSFDDDGWSNLARHFEMGKKLADKALAKFEAQRDVWQEVLDGVREIKAGKGKRINIKVKSYNVRVRYTT